MKAWGTPVWKYNWHVSDDELSSLLQPQCDDPCSMTEGELVPALEQSFTELGIGGQEDITLEDVDEDDLSVSISVTVSPFV